MRGLPKPSECLKGTEEDDRDEFTWTPLPPPNMDALISQMPLVPMSMEQLCAPIDEGEENECLERLAVHSIDGSTDKQSLVVEATADVATVTLDRKAVKSKYPDPSLAACSRQNNDLADAKSSAGSTAPVIKASNAPVRKEPLVRISQFIRQSKKNNEHLHAAQKSVGSSRDQNKANNLKSMNTGKSNRPPKPHTLQSNFINLTDSSEPVQHQPPKKAPSYGRSSTSGFKNTAQSQRQNPDSTSSTRSSITGSELRRISTHHREPFEEEEEFDKLCGDIDLDTIGDFSGSESDPGLSRRAPTTTNAPSSKPQHVTAHSSSMVKQGKYQQSSAKLSSVTVKADGTTKQRFLKGKASVRSESQMTRSDPGAQGPSRLNSLFPLPASNVSSTTRFLGGTSKTAAAPVPQRSKFSYPTSASSQMKTTGVKRCDAPPDSSTRAKHPRLETDARPRHSSETDARTRHSSEATSRSGCSSAGSSSSGRATSTGSFQSVDTRTAHRTTAQNVRVSSGPARAAPLPTHASHGATTSAACSTASGSTSQRMSQLSTENCPMCNTRFPTW